MYRRRRFYGRGWRRPLWGRPMLAGRPFWGWRRGPGCCGLIVLMFGALALLALLRVPFFFR